MLSIVIEPKLMSLLCISYFSQFYFHKLFTIFCLLCVILIAFRQKMGVTHHRRSRFLAIQCKYCWKFCCNEILLDFFILINHFVWNETSVTLSKQIELILNETYLKESRSRIKIRSKYCRISFKQYLCIDRFVF